MWRESYERPDEDAEQESSVTYLDVYLHKLIKAKVLTEEESRVVKGEERDESIVAEER